MFCPGFFGKKITVFVNISQSIATRAVLPVLIIAGTLAQVFEERFIFKVYFGKIGQLYFYFTCSEV